MGVQGQKEKYASFIQTWTTESQATVASVVHRADFLRRLTRRQRVELRSNLRKTVRILPLQKLDQLFSDIVAQVKGRSRIASVHEGRFLDRQSAYSPSLVPYRLYRVSGAKARSTLPSSSLV